MPSPDNRRVMLLPYNPAHPDYAETHLEDKWCEKAGCRPACGRELTVKREPNASATEPKAPATGPDKAGSAETGGEKAECACICHGDNPSRLLLAAKCCPCKLEPGSREPEKLNNAQKSGSERLLPGCWDRMEGKLAESSLSHCPHFTDGRKKSDCGICGESSISSPPRFKEGQCQACGCWVFSNGKCEQCFPSGNQHAR